MAVNAKIGAGTVLQITVDAGTTYVPINGVDSLGATGSTKAEVESTALEDTDKQYIAGMSEGESKSMTFKWDESDAGQALLKAQALLGNVAGFKILFSNGKSATFNMTLLGWSVDDVSGDSAMTASVSGRITGAITWA